MKKELKDQFLPTNTAWMARESLKKLKQTGSVRDYVKEFSSLILDIKDMSEVDKLFNFMSGLQGWAQTELRRQGVQDPLQLLNAMRAEATHRGLMYVELLTGGQKIVALVDSGATHNFVSTREAARLRLKLAKDDSKIKAVTAKHKRRMAWQRTWQFRWVNRKVR